MDFVAPFEVDFFVKGIRKTHIWELGSEKWFERHEKLIKLNQQCILEASDQNREEVTKDLLIVEGKTKALVHEILTVFVWRKNVLSEIPPEIENKSSIIKYSILYHELIALSLLETVLFHQDGCESLEETALDLVDYSVQAVTQLIALIHHGYLDDNEENNNGQNMEFKLGIHCLTVLFYLIDRVEVLPLSVSSRLVKFHDVPYLLSEALTAKPWQRRSRGRIERFVNGNWNKAVGDDIVKITKTEAQTWLAFRQLILNNNLMSEYEWCDFRSKAVGRCVSLLNELVLDQLPLLTDLKHYLCTISMQNNFKTNKSSFLLEEVPEIQSEIVKELDIYGSKRLVSEISKLLDDSELANNVAKRLNVAYDIDKILTIQEDDQTDAAEYEHNCGQCHSKAVKKCSNCELVFYCSRDCQVKNWANHKEFCQQNSVQIRESRK